MTSKNIQAVRGMNDVLPSQAHAWEHLEALVARVLRQYGYAPIRMPMVERTELFVRSIGEVTDIVEKEMYSFVDRLNGESLTLRPEGTASCVRAVLEHNLLYGGPQRLYYHGPMFRHERPQKGRYRQFHQIGVEAFGFEGPDVDAEQILLCARLWRLLGLTDVRLEINTLGSSEARARYRARLVQYLRAREPDLDEDSRRRLEGNPLRVLDSKSPAMRPVVEAAPRLLDDLDEPSLAHFEGLQAILRGAGISFSINPRLVRGLDYYNRTVFEWITDDLGAQGTICAGGRYDGLVEQLGGKPAPACGFALGTERVLLLMEVRGALPVLEGQDAYLVHQGPRATTHAHRVVEQLRDRGLEVVMHGGGGSFKSQMKRADASGARYAVIIGEDEAEQGRVSLKPLRDAAAQALVDVAEAADIMCAARSGRH